MHASEQVVREGPRRAESAAPTQPAVVEARVRRIDKRHQNIEIARETWLRELVAPKKAREGSIALAARHHYRESRPDLDARRLLSPRSEGSVNTIETHARAPRRSAVG